MTMRKWIGIVIILLILSVFALGCASSSKETKTRCPKCASFYDTREGEEMFRYMQGR